MDLPAGWTTGRVTVDGVGLQTYRVGDPGGEPLVLLHGFYESARCWTPLVDALIGSKNGSPRGEFTSGSDVVLYDARGHGRSDAPDTGYGIDDRVADLLGVLDALDVGTPILVGHSMGGSTAAWTAARHPDRVAGLVLEDPAGMRPEPADFPPDERARAVRERVVDRSGRSLDEHRAEYDDPASEYARRQAAADANLRPEIAEIARAGYPHLADAFPRIDSPTLVLRRDQNVDDRVTDLAMADDLENGRLVHVPEASHAVFHDRPDTALRELRAFLRRVKPPETDGR